MTDEFNHAFWAYRAVLTQANVGGGNVQLRIIPQDRTVILYALLGEDNYAADRNAECWITDKNHDIIGHLMYPSPLDDEAVPLITDNKAAVTLKAGLQLEKRLIMCKGDKFHVQVTSLVQNETVTVAMRALIDTKKPTIATTGSTGTVTVAETYNKVM